MTQMNWRKLLRWQVPSHWFPIKFLRVSARCPAGGGPCSNSAPFWKILANWVRKSVALYPAYVLLILYGESGHMVEKSGSKAKRGSSSLALAAIANMCWCWFRKNKSDNDTGGLAYSADRCWSMRNFGAFIHEKSMSGVASKYRIIYTVLILRFLRKWWKESWKYAAMVVFQPFCHYNFCFQIHKRSFQTFPVHILYVRMQNTFIYPWK